jgi:Protein of unknown function (DUF3025)
MDWDPTFVDRAPALCAFAEAAEPLRTCGDWPALPLLQALCDARGIVNARGMPMCLVGERTEEPYETRLYLRGEMHVRGAVWHDLFNVLAWLAYPKTKAALNARHHEEETGCGPTASDRGRRTRVQDALTVFDEHGVIVAAADPELLEMIRAFEWKRLFWTERARFLEHLRVFVIGHALCEKLLAPYVGLTAHAVLLSLDADVLRSALPDALAQIDARVAERVRSGPAFDSPRNLSPLPVLGVPGWFRGNALEAFYDDAAYFRSGRRARPPR